VSRSLVNSFFFFLLSFSFLLLTLLTLSLPLPQITYLALYAYNGPYFPFSEALGPGLGAHDGDLERVTVRLDAESGEVRLRLFFFLLFLRGRKKNSLFSFSLSLSKRKQMIGCFFSAHRPRDGGWAAARDIERFEPPHSSSSPFSPRGRIVAYVAKHGHGTYPSSGTQLRAGFFANDRTSSRGWSWAPRRLVLLRAAGTKEEKGPKPSRAFSLSAVAALLEEPELGIAACRGCELEAPSSSSSSSSSSRTMLPPSDPRATGVVVERDTDEATCFGEFEGKFGETPAARSQGWWSKAECPVSRGVALRVAGQFWPERESLHSRR
jgi:hypothetical protein